MRTLKLTENTVRWVECRVPLSLDGDIKGFILLLLFTVEQTGPLAVGVLAVSRKAISRMR